MIRFSHISETICLFSILLAAISCEKNDNAYIEGQEEMAFQVFTPDNMSLLSADGYGTKAEISEESDFQIALFGKQDNTNIFNPLDHIMLDKPAPGAGSIWKPAQKYYWQDSPRYHFHAFAHTPVKGDASLSTLDQGKSFTISQPSSYVVDKGQSTTIDYLLSYEVNYEPSTTHQVVPIVLEHAMTKISLYITRATAMNNIDIDNVSVAFKNMKHQATLICNKQKDFNKDYETHNEWSYNIGQATTSYTLDITGAANTRNLIKDEANTTNPVMCFIAIPNDHEGLKDYMLELSYKVTVDGKSMTYSRAFELYKVTEMWESGHNVIYNFLIDNGIHLTGEIADWIKVDYIEGTILPPIMGGDVQNGDNTGK